MQCTCARGPPCCPSPCKHGPNRLLPGRCRRRRWPARRPPRARAARARWGRVALGEIDVEVHGLGLRLSSPRPALGSARRATARHDVFQALRHELGRCAGEVRSFWHRSHDAAGLCGVLGAQRLQRPTHPRNGLRTTRRMPRPRWLQMSQQPPFGDFRSSSRWPLPAHARAA